MNDKVLYQVIGGGEVVGQEVDAENRLIYLIRKDGTIIKDLAINVSVIPQFDIASERKTIRKITPVEEI